MAFLWYYFGAAATEHPHHHHSTAHSHVAVHAHHPSCPMYHHAGRYHEDTRNDDGTSHHHSSNLWRQEEAGSRSKPEHREGHASREPHTQHPRDPITPTTPKTPRRHVQFSVAAAPSRNTGVQPRRRILFYRKHKPYYGFTNFSPHPVYYNNKRYPTSEHLFQSFKVRLSLSAH